MSLSFFDNKALIPNDDMVALAVGTGKAFWDELQVHAASYGSPVCEWKFYSKAAGWSFLIKCGKRTLVYFIPQEGFFKANFVFGERAVEAARAANLLPEILALIEEAKVHMEGRSFMFDIKTEADCGTAQQLIGMKYEN